MVMSTWPCSALWYMASLRALSLAFPVRRVPPPLACGANLFSPGSEPSARISSRDSTSPFSFSDWDRSFRKTFLEGKRERIKTQADIKRKQSDKIE